MTVGQFAQTAFLLVYLTVFLVCLPACRRLLIRSMPVRHFDPIKVSFAFMGVAFTNSFIVRLGGGWSLWSSNDLAWILASAITSVTFAGAVIVTFLMEKVVCRVGKP